MSYECNLAPQLYDLTHKMLWQEEKRWSHYLHAAGARKPVEAASVSSCLAEMDYGLKKMILKFVDVSGITL